MRILFVCTANRCRSPLAAALLADTLALRRYPATVRSAGFLPGGAGVPAPLLSITGDLPPGVQSALRAHRSRRLSPSLVAGADLVVTMTRQHLVELTAVAPRGWGHCFTLAELLVRARCGGALRPGEDPAAWVRRIGGGRSGGALLALPLADDVSDPMGGQRAAYLATRRRLEAGIAELADLLCPPPATPGSPALSAPI